MTDEPKYTSVVFEFNGHKFEVNMTEFSARQLFYDLTGMEILNSENKFIEGIPKVITVPEVQHPSKEELVAFFKDNLDVEISSELIRNTFYRECSQWRKVFVSVYDKLQTAMRVVETEEKGKFVKIRHGRYVNYKFVSDVNKSLSEFAI